MTVEMIDKPRAILELRRRTQQCHSTDIGMIRDDEAPAVIPRTRAEQLIYASNCVYWDREAREGHALGCVYDGHYYHFDVPHPSPATTRIQINTAAEWR